jgi:spermidine/putrescine transport system permease protein
MCSVMLKSCGRPPGTPSRQPDLLGIFAVKSVWQRVVAWAQAAPDVVAVVFFFVAPLLVLIGYSFGRQNSLTQDVRLTGTLRAYRLLFSDLYRPVLLRTLGLSVACLALCIVIGIPASLAMIRCTPRLQRRLLILVVFPSFISFTVRIYAWVGLLGNAGPVAGISDRLTGHRIVLLYRPGSLLIGMITAYVPLFVLPVYVSMQRLAPNLVEAAADLGGRSLTTVRTIVLPLALPGIITGSALVAILSMGEFLIPTVLGGGKVLLLGTLLAEQAGGRNKPLGGAIASTLMIVMAGVGTVAFIIHRRATTRNA